MIAIEIKGDIVIFNELPLVWQTKEGLINNFRHGSTPEQVYDLGFRPYINPTISEGQEIGDAYKDMEKDIFTRRVIDTTKTIEELYDLKLKEGLDVFKKYKEQLIYANYEDVILQETTPEFKSLVKVMKKAMIRIRADLRGYVEVGDYDSLNAFTYNTEEAEQLKESINSFKN